jgi:hypothetical protein
MIEQVRSTPERPIPALFMTTVLAVAKGWLLVGIAMSFRKMTAENGVGLKVLLAFITISIVAAIIADLHIMYTFTLGWPPRKKQWELAAVISSVINIGISLLAILGMVLAAVAGPGDGNPPRHDPIPGRLIVGIASLLAWMQAPALIVVMRGLRPKST